MRSCKLLLCSLLHSNLLLSWRIKSTSNIRTSYRSISVPSHQHPSLEGEHAASLSPGTDMGGPKGWVRGWLPPSPCDSLQVFSSLTRSPLVLLPMKSIRRITDKIMRLWICYFFLTHLAKFLILDKVCPFKAFTLGDMTFLSTMLPFISGSLF